MAKQLIKIFSHNDLDGFGAPLLLEAVQDKIFPDYEIDLTNCGAGRIDDEFAKWLQSTESNRATDVYIMDMTPDSDYTFKQLNENFANHWLVFDHHESEEELRQRYSDNSITATNSNVNPSATSLVWDWIKRQPEFKEVEAAERDKLAYLVELIRAYDTWDWQNDPGMSEQEKTDADNLDQLFWFYPLNDSADFVHDVFAAGWEEYAKQNSLLIKTLNERRAKYLEHHLKDVLITKIDGHQLGIVYADDYKSEVAHELLNQNPSVEAALVISPVSVSLRSNGKMDVAKFAEKYFNGGGHADAAGGRLEINPVEVGEQAVADHLAEKIKNSKESKETTDGGTLADNLDPAIAEKMAQLFKK
ncbi:DHHA1 domain-containing protein [Lactobacillaceae bacterium 24-114]